MSTDDHYGSQIRLKGHDLVVDLADLRNIMLEAVEAKYEGLKESAGSTLASIRDKAASMARNTGEGAAAIVRESPWKFMAGAVVAGMFASWYLRRR